MKNTSRNCTYWSSIVFVATVSCLFEMAGCDDEKDGGTGDGTDGGLIDGGIDGATEFDGLGTLLKDNPANVGSISEYFSKPVNGSSEVTLHHVRAKAVKLLSLPNAVLSVSLESMFSFSVDGLAWQDRISRSSFESRVMAHHGRLFRYGMPFAIESSVDGVDWEKETIPAASMEPLVSLSGILFGVDPQSGVMWRKDTAGNWAGHIRPRPDKPIAAMAADGTFLVGVGKDGLAIKSSNGELWSDISLGTMADFTTLLSWEGQFVGLLSDGRIYVLGKDGAWRKAFEDPMVALTSLAATDSAIYALGRNTESGQAAVYRTADLTKWQILTAAGSGPIVSATSFGSVVYAADDRGNIFTVGERRPWAISRKRARRFTAVKLVGDRFIAVGEGGLLAVSADGITWTQGHHPFKGDLFDVGAAPDANRHIVSGAEGLLESTDGGNNWSPIVSTLINVQALAFGGTKWMAIQSDEKVFFSSDAITWTRAPAIRSPASASAGGYWGAEFWAGKWCARRSTESPVWCTKDQITWSIPVYENANSQSPMGLRKLIANGVRISFIAGTRSESQTPASQLGYLPWSSELTSLKLLAFTEQRTTPVTNTWAATARKAFRFEIGPGVSNAVTARRFLGELPMTLTDIAAGPNRLVLVGEGEMIASLPTAEGTMQ